MLQQVSETLERIEGNWEFLFALDLLINTTRRLLALAVTDNVRDQAFDFLSKARELAFKWTKELKMSAEQTEDANRAILESKSSEAALVCASTFDVERLHLASIFVLPEDTATFLQCCIIIRENDRTLVATEQTQITLLYSRHLRLLYDSLPILIQSEQALHLALSNSWSAYVCGSTWEIAENAYHWVQTRTLADSCNEGSIVHYDILSGSVIVDGVPLGRLTSEYEEHTAYRTLFQNSKIDVMPATNKGFQFSAKSDHLGYGLQFGMTTASKRSFKKKQMIGMMIKIKHTGISKSTGTLIMPMNLSTKKIT